MLIIGRLFIGVNAGLNAGLIPMYLSEISPTNLRGMVNANFANLISFVPIYPFLFTNLYLYVTYVSIDA